MKNRYTSSVVWASLLAQVLSILVILGVITPTQSDTINGVVVALLQALVVFGVLNNPTDQQHF